MALKETLETIGEAARETQKAITTLKVLRHQEDGVLSTGKYIKAYKRELEAESELKWLAEYLARQRKACQKELDEVKEELSKECMHLKCMQVEDMFQNIVDDENGDFGEE